MAVKPAAFDFHAPESGEEVLSLLATYGDDARLLAGGQSLVPLMNMRILRPGVLISLNRCRDLAYLRDEDGEVVCGAMIRQAEAEETDLIQSQVPLLAAALPYVGVRASRNRGTVCGSLAHADPLAELPSVAAALEATFVITGTNGRREVTAETFFVSELATCIDTGEMLTEVRFPKTVPNGRGVFLEVGNRAHGFAVVGIAAYFEIAPDNRCKKRGSPPWEWARPQSDSQNPNEPSTIRSSPRRWSVPRRKRRPTRLNPSATFMPVPVTDDTLPASW